MNCTAYAGCNRRTLMAELPDTLADRQRAFAAHLRDPSNPAPPGIEARRMAVYRELFYNAIEGLLAANFPVIRRTLDDTAWHALVHEFHREHRCATPLFTEVAQEFIEWLATTADRHVPWLPELAHYEWMELRAQIDDTAPPSHDPAGDILAGVPLLSPQAWPLAYAWPVDRIGPDFIPAAPPPEPTLLLVRRDASMQVHFAALSPLAFRLLQLVQANDSASGDALIDTLAGEAGLPGDIGFIQDARAMLGRLRSEDTVIGVRSG